MAAETDEYPGWLERLIGIAIAAVIALCLLPPGAYPQQFQPRTEATALPPKTDPATLEATTLTTPEPPGYLGIIQRGCAVETVTDNQGKLNGYRLRVRIIYETANVQWVRVLAMYRPEEEKKAHLDCLKWHQQTFKKIWDAKEKARKKAHAARQPA